ncbi:hypothetical protein B0H16DRAFT_1468959 [Mycena metata]|uniref:Uncharacterized protein n=1 Tax=Mycena metata TaxID=1033252 RepID=A0AAD7I135_9AGAR|nr:hypothetical protein B0H16DRAFT_1468959 [Mycena metata]
MHKLGGNQNLGLIGPKWKSQWRVEELAKAKSAAELGHPDLGGLSKRKRVALGSRSIRANNSPNFGRKRRVQGRVWENLSFVADARVGVGVAAANINVDEVLNAGMLKK